MWMAIGRGTAYTGCAYSYDAKNWYLSQTSGSLFGTHNNVLTERYAPVASASWQSVSLSSTGQYQTAVVTGGTIWTSSDYGVSWIARTTPGSRGWWWVSLSSTGQYQTAVVNGGNIWTSSDYGVNWTERTTGTPAATRGWYSVALSATGQYQTAVVYGGGGNIWISSDYGVSWTARTAPGNRFWWSVSLSSTGQYQTAVVQNGNIWTSSDYGVNWTERTTGTPAATREWFLVSLSSTGQYQTAVVYRGGNIWTSSNYGVDWTSRATSLSWYSVSLSSTGQYQTAVVTGGNIWTSSNYGVDWTPRATSSSWYSVSLSSTGQYQTAVVSGGAIFISSNFGETWSSGATDSRSLGVAYGKDASGVGMWVVTAGRRDRDVSANLANTMAYSYDGKLWRGISASAGLSEQAWSVAYGKDGFGVGMWVCAGYDTHCGLKWSYDGVSWNATMAASGAAVWAGMAAGRRALTVYWNGSMWLASTSDTRNGEPRGTGIAANNASGVPGYLLYSYNGKNWLPVLAPNTYVSTASVYSVLPNPAILDFGSFYDDQVQRGTMIANTTARTVGAVMSNVPIENINTIVPYGRGSLTTGQVPFLLGGDSGLMDTAAGVVGIAGSGAPPLTSDLAAATTSLSTSVDGGITWRAVPNSTKVMTKVNKILCDETTQQIVAVGAGNYSVATSTLAKAADADGWTGVFGSRMTDTRAGLFEKYGTGASWFGGAKMWIASGRAQTRRGSSLAVSVNGTVWQDAKIVSQVAAGGGGLVSRTTGGAVTTMVSSPFTTVTLNTGGPLYTFTTFTFDNAGATGREGPDLSACRTRYATTAPTATWAQNSSYLNMTTRGIQEWQVPATGSYRIRAVGAAGGARVTYNRGRDIVLNVELTKGEVIRILVGQMGVVGSYQGGGGGGTFVVRGSQVSPTAILVAGGGGGGGGGGDNPANGVSDAAAPNTGNGNSGGGNQTGGNDRFGTGGTSGQGGNNSNYSDGGAGLIGNGTGSASNQSPSSVWPKAFTTGGTGGQPTSNNAFGGFGGGGSTNSASASGGGGGGYSGGGGGGNHSNYGWSSGGGGGSYGITTPTDSGAVNAGHGFVIITPNFTIIGPEITTTITTNITRTTTPLTFNSSVIPYTAPTTPLLTYTDSAAAFSTQVSSIATNSQYNRAVVGGSGVQFVAGGRGGIVVSNDGQNWTAAAAGAGASTVFQTPTNVTTRTGGGGFDASFGTVALTQRLTTPASYPTGNWFSISLSATGQYQSAVIYSGGSGAYIYTSSDYGVSWTQRTQFTGTWQSISLSSTGQYQSAVINGGNIYTSSDYGVSWTQRTQFTGGWYSISLSSTGQYQSAVIYSGGSGAYIYTSSDYGVSWTQRTQFTGSWISISLSSTGQYQSAVINSGGSGAYIYTSSDYGVSWTQRTQFTGQWYSISLSTTGQYQSAVIYNGGSGTFIYTSTDFGATWVQRSTATRTNAFTRIKSSASGQYQIATSGPVGNTNGQLYVSSDYGQSWIPRRGLGTWLGVAVSATGAVMMSFLTPSAATAVIIRSTDFGNTFTDVPGTTLALPAYWRAISVSNSAAIQTAVAYGGSIYRSLDTGATWSNTGITIDGSANANTTTPLNWQDIAVSAETGAIQVTCVSGGYLYLSTNTGESWNSSAVSIDGAGTQTTNRVWQAVAVSADGQYGLACVNSTTAAGFLYRSVNTGATWTSSNIVIDGVGSQATNRSWQDVGMSANGKYQVACLNSNTQTVFTSNIASTVSVMVTPPGALTTTFGTTWTQRGADIDGEAVGDQSGYSVSLSADGTVVAIGAPINTGASGRESGQVRVYALNAGVWSQRGADIDGAAGMSSLPMVVTATTTSGSRIWWSVSLSSTGQYQTAVVRNSQIHTSSDFGVNWTPRHSSYNTSDWTAVSLSSTGQYQTAIVYGGQIHTSSNFGIDWTPRHSSYNTSNWYSVSLSSSGQYQTAVVVGGQIHTSSNFGIDWTPRYNTANWWSVSLSSSGQYQTAVVINGQIHTSSNFGIDWTPRYSSLTWYSVSLSSTGQYQTAVVSGGQIHTSSDFGINWTPRHSSYNTATWWSVSVSSTGQYQTAVVDVGQIHTSSNFGIDWTPRYNSSTEWRSVSLSSTGQYQTVVVRSGQIHTSRNYGFNWSEYASYEITEGDQSGSSVSLSANGNTVAVGAPYYDLSGIINRGQVRVFDWSGSAWAVRGTNILLGEGSNDYSGMSVSLSEDGKVVAVGASLNDGAAGTDSGHVRVYAWDGSAWAQRGADIDGGYGLTATNRVVTATGDSGTGVWHSVSLSSTGQYQSAVVNSTYIYTSSNYGTTWTPRQTDANRSWWRISLSSSGQYQTAVVNNINSNGFGYIYTSSDYGITWTPRQTDANRGWYSVSLSSSGQYQSAVIGNDNTGRIYISSDYGVTWTQNTQFTGTWYNISVSSTGQYQSAVNYNGGSGSYIYTSTNYGVTWTQLTTNGAISNTWGCIAVSSTGQYQTAGAISNKYLYTSSDFGVNWSQKTTLGSWVSVSVSSTGQYQTATSEGGYVYTSSDFGVIWTARYAPRNWSGVSLSSTGQYQTAVVYNNNNFIYFSRDYGFTWSPSASYEITDGDQSGSSVSLSADGSVVAVGSPYTDTTTGINSGRVRVLAWSGSAWAQRGSDILGEATNDQSGWSTSMSADGTTVAIGAPYNNGANGIGCGQVRVYKWSGSAWGTVGTVDIDGEAGALTPPRVVTATTTSGSRVWNSVAISATGQYQTAVVSSGSIIYTSSNYGVTWTPQTVTESSSWRSVSLSSTGQYQSAVGSSNFIRTSSDYGINWTSRTAPGAPDWRSVSLSATGQYQTAVPNGNLIQTSSDFGVTWITRTTPGSLAWWWVSLSSTGQYQTVVAYGANIYTSSDYGVNWTARTTPGSRQWYSVSLSSTGQYQTAVAGGGQIHTSSNFGIDWTPRYNVLFWSSVSLSSTGQYQTAIALESQIHTSSNFGIDWTQRYSVLNWLSVSVSSTGQYQTASASSSTIYFSRDYGFTWSQYASYEVVSGGDQSGYSLSLSADGNSLAVGAPYNDAGATGADRGHVRVYDYNGSTAWNQRGTTDIDGEASNDLAGWSVSLSADGSTVAFGAPMNDGSGNLLPNSGSVRVFNVATTNAITYTSSNSSVADICSNILIIKGVNGTSNIVATQGATTTNGVLTVNGALYTMVYTIGSLSTISYIYYSKDYGASWTSLTTAGSRSWSSIALSENGSTISATTIDASGGVWVYAMPDEQYYRAGAVANSGSTTTPSTVRAITYGNSGTGATTDGYWVAGADASANTLAYSSNGMDWTAVVGSKTTLFNAVNGVAYGADGAGTPLWVAVGAPFVGSVPGTTAFSIAYSYNMTTWVGVRNAANFTGQGNHVAYGQDEYGAGVWVAVGQSDGVLAANLGDSALYNSGGTPNTTIFYSYDGANWAAGTGAGVFAVSGTDIAWGVDASGVGTWVATGIGFTDPTTGAVIAGGQVAHSVNGRSWAPIRAPASIVPAMSPATIPANERRNVIPAPPTSTGFAASLYTDIWRMLGGDIDGEAATDQSGWSVALSADGTTLAIGAPYANTNDTGHVRVYKYNPNKTAAPAGWEQLGADIDAETSGDNNGWRVALSADGTTLAIGTPYANADDKGRVRVYKYNPNKSTTPVGWEQLGADIDGEAGNDNSGYSVALSADGTTLAIGAIYSNTPAGGDDNVGHVRVYKYNPNKTTAQTNQSLAGFGPVGWDRLGADIDGEVANDYSGWSVALSADGTTLAIGAIGANSPAGTDNVGHVRVYKYNPNKTTAQTNQSLAGFGPAGWDRLGADIDGEAANDNSGYSVALSADGTTLAIGAPYANTPTGTDNTGHVRVYKYNPNKTLEQTNQGLTGFGPVGWDRLGEDIDGEAQGDYSGYSVALSADGTTLAIGAYEASTPAGTNNTGHVRVYKYNVNKTTTPAGWDQLGVDIDGEAQDDLSGYSVALSADGTTLAIGARVNDGAGLNNSGHVRVYKLITAQAPATFSISNPAIADIENGGFIVIKSVDSGSATITAVQPASPPFTFAPVIVQGTLTVSGSVYTLVYDTFYPIFTPFPGAVAGNTITVAYGRAGSQGAGAPLWIVGGAGTTNVFARSSIPSAITTAGAWSVVANTAPSANAPFAVCNSIGYSNGVWVAGNNTDATNILARSTDGGITWTPVSASSVSGIIAGAVAVGANAFCNYSLAVADYSNDTNLRSWVAVQGTKNFFFEGGVSAIATVSLNIVASTYNSSGNNTRAWWVAGGVGLSGVASLGYTTDPSGATGWTKSASSDIANLSAVNAVAFSPHTQRWLAVGAGASISLGTNVLYSDASGATWTSSAVATALTPVITLNTCVWNQAPASASSAGRWLVGGTRSDLSDNISTSASVYISTDVSGAASPWTPITGTGAILSQVYSLAYNGVVWIAAGVPATDTGSTSTLMRTTDPTGATGWQGIAATNTSTGGFDTAARSVSWNADQQMWVATGENTGAAVDASFSSVIYSLDISGSSGTWRTVRESNSLCFSDEGTGLAFTGDKWYAVGYGNNQIVATTGTAANAVGSSATASWTPVAHGTALTRATDIAYTGRRLIATGAGSGATTGIIMSTDTTGSSWTSATTGFTDASGGGTSVAFEASYDGVGRVVATGKSATNTICVSVTDGGSTSWNTPTAPSTQFSSSNTFDTTTQSLFTTGGNSVAYVGNDTLFAVGGNDVHWTGKQWVAVGRNSTENPVAPVVSTPSSSAPPVEVVGNTTPVATSPDGIMWQCVRTSQAPNLSDGTFVATNSRIGATPLIDSRITIADGGDTEVVNMDYGGSGTGIAQIDIIAELTPVSHAASSVSSSGAVGVIGAAGNGGANSVGNASIPSFDTTSFLITTRPQ
jgi:hypothetical protein